MKLFIIGVIFIAVIATAISGGSYLTGAIASGVPTTGSQNTVEISVDDVTEDAKWYEYDINGKNVRFFVVRADDGSIKTAFDACDVCYRAGKGYNQEGKYMVCNNCGNRYPISGLGTENKNPGGCWPSYLPNTVVDGNVVIQETDLAEGEAEFI